MSRMGDWVRRRLNRVRSVPDTVAVVLNTPLTVDVLANDRGSGLKITHVNSRRIVDGGASIDCGSVTVALIDGELRITPDNAFTGQFAFFYTMNDGRKSRIGQVVGEVS